MDNIKAAKYELIQEIMAITDNGLINQLMDFLKEGKNDIVAYTADGKPLTQADYVKEVLEAKEQVKAGNFYTHEEVLKEIKKW